MGHSVLSKRVKASSQSTLSIPSFLSSSSSVNSFAGVDLLNPSSLSILWHSMHPFFTLSSSSSGIPWFTACTHCETFVTIDPTRAPQAIACIILHWFKTCCSISAAGVMLVFRARIIRSITQGEKLCVSKSSTTYVYGLSGNVLK